MDVTEFAKALFLFLLPNEVICSSFDLHFGLFDGVTTSCAGVMRY